MGSLLSYHIRIIKLYTCSINKKFNYIILKIIKLACTRKWSEDLIRKKQFLRKYERPYVVFFNQLSST